MTAGERLRAEFVDGSARSRLREEQMAKYGEYAKIKNGQVLVRHSVQDDWGGRGWPHRLAWEFGEYIKELADEAAKDDPRVIELAELLEDGPDSEGMMEMALRLHRAGYRKRS